MKSRMGIPYGDNLDEIPLPPVVAMRQPGATKREALRASLEGQVMIHDE